jgi:hypothetical protein
MITRLMMLCLVQFVFSTSAFCSQYEFHTLEEINDMSEAFIYGEIIGKEEIVEGNTYCYEYEMEVEDGSISRAGEKVKFRTSQGWYSDGKRSPMELSIELMVHKKYLAFIYDIDGINHITHLAQGVFRIENGTIHNTDITIDEFIASINKYDRDKEKIELQLPSLSQRIAGLKYNPVAKVAEIELLDGKFSYASGAAASIIRTFVINPDSAYDYNGDRIPFNDNKNAVQACLNEWNNVANSNITYT